MRTPNTAAVAVAVSAVVLFLLYRQRGRPALKSHPRGPRDRAEPLRAVVAGATGATGTRLVDQLLSAGHRVTALVRRETLREDNVDNVDRRHTLYREVVVPDLRDADGSVFEGQDVFFNCLGTTRAGGHAPKPGDVGGAEHFVRVEVALAKSLSEKAVAAGVKAASVVSAEGANHALLQGHDWIKYIHPLLYVRTLGEKEQVTIRAGFERVTIFRPGLLNRQVGEGVMRRVQDYWDLGLTVSTLASAMVRDAEASGAAPLIVIETNPLIEQSSKL
jgi:hypothetical protein